MGIDDVREVVARVPVVVAVHLEALNHCYLTRAELAAAVPEVVIPRDGETVEAMTSRKPTWMRSRGPGATGEFFSKYAHEARRCRSHRRAGPCPWLKTVNPSPPVARKLFIATR